MNAAARPDHRRHQQRSPRRHPVGERGGHLGGGRSRQGHFDRRRRGQRGDRLQGRHAGGPDVRDRYLELSGGFPTTLRNVANVALLEEYRYYVREEHAVAGDDSSDYVPRLVKARFYPNTEVAHVSDPEFGSEVSDNILDLQFALGIDADGDGGVEEGIEPGGVSAELPEGAIDKAEDEWLFNVAADVDDDGVAAEAEKWNPAYRRPGARLRPRHHHRAHRSP